MKRKSLICIAILNCFLCLAILVFGVYSAVSVTLTLSGTISFTAYDKEVYINNVKVSNYIETDVGYKKQSKTLDSYSNMYANPNTAIDISNITVLKGETAEIAIDMMSVKSNYLKCNLSYNSLPAGVSVESTSVYLSKNVGESVNTGESKVYKIYITNTNSGSLSLSDLNLKISFEEKTSILQHDATNQYYYVEMGTLPTSTGSEYIRWKYVSATGTSRYSYSSTAPTGLGYFILQSDTLIQKNGYYLNQCCFTNDINWDTYTHSQNGWTNIKANDYATSTVRQYINGNKVYKHAKRVTGNGTFGEVPNTDGPYSDMYTDFNIDPQNDIVYQKIIGRTLSDLYKNNLDDESETLLDVSFPDFTGADVVMTESQVDKFWIMSSMEAKNMLGEGEWLSGGDLDWITQGSMCDSDTWMLRTTNTYSDYDVWWVSSDGEVYCDWSSRDWNFIRASFKCQ